MSCFVCKKEGAKHCSRCRLIYYCGVECQKKDWPLHKLKCKPREPELSVRIKENQNSLSR